MPDALIGRARACLYGLASFATLWALVLAASVTVAQEPPPRHWDRDAARTLLAYIEQIGSHGLNSRDYAPVELERAIASGEPAMLEKRATESFGKVAVDLAIGHVRTGKRGRYFIPSDPVDADRIARLIDTAIADRNVSHVLDALAPQNREYEVLRAGLARLQPHQAEERRKIEVSLERWRWLPRNVGTRYLLVNIPEYRVRLFENSREAASHRVIVGRSSTPTPQFSATVNAVVLNPSWTVPQSIIAESVGSLVRNRPEVARSRGYTWSYTGGGLRVVQRPGPQNSLGQMKLDMPNAFRVYLHDTPGKELFEREQRTFSHGCIRVDKPFDLALELLGRPEWNRSAIDGVVAAGQTRRIALEAPTPVYIVYFTAVANADGRIQYLDDPYRLDAATAAQLSGGP